MILAWRGVVDEDGDVVAWPMLLMDHAQAFQVLPRLANYTCRWRQWEPGGRIDFDPDSTPADQAKVEEWINAQPGQET